VRPSSSSAALALPLTCGQRLSYCFLPLLTIYPARRSLQKGRADNDHGAACRPRGSHKIHFGTREKALASQFHDKQQGSARLKEFASWHEWFYRECESPDEVWFGRAALSKALASHRFTSRTPINVLEAI
jgi:hypothetical protein